MDSSIFILWNRAGPEETTEKAEEGKGHHNMQRWPQISSSSSKENPSTYRLPNLISITSFMMDIFHLSSSLARCYSISLILNVLIGGYPHCQLLTVVLLTLYLHIFNSILVMDFLDFWICFTKLINRWMRILLTWGLPEIGSIMLLWVAYGRSYIIFTFELHCFCAEQIP